MRAAMQRPYRLSCHCGEIAIEVDAELSRLVECNCSTCRRSGFLHRKVDAAAVRLLTEKRRVSTYVWRGLAEGHHFCPTCGTAILRSGYPGDRVSLNARCIEGVDVFTLEVERYDGRNDMPPGPLP
ncbi:Gfa-like protein [Sinorhizobium fredii]|uniref:Gfa-like protein n=2 Tax=Rhizobium fredii TaxID=380 RepID=A0A2A6LT63_RHIFR|nr:Gfa-like protein [Sinorhizobium fredii]